MITEMIAHITCACGQKFQILLEPVNPEDAVIWDEEATAQMYHEHQALCGGGKA